MSRKEEPEPASPAGKLPFHLIAENACDFFAIMNEEGQFTYVNPSYSTALGYPAEEMLTLRAPNLIHPDDRKRVTETDETKMVEFRMQHADGSWVWLEGSTFSISWQGQVYVVNMARDITERKYTEERLRQGMESSPSGVIIVNEEGQIILVNVQIERAFGYSREDLIGQPVEILMPERFRTMHSFYRDRFGAEPKLRPMGAGRDLWGLRKDGSEFPIEVGLNAIRTDHGLMIISTVIDITARKHIEDQLIAAKEQAEEMTRLKTAFLANMSHEIRTPLTAIIGFADILYKEMLEEKRDYVEFIRQSGHRLLGTLNSVLDLAQLEGRTVKLHPEPMDITAVIAKTVALFQQQAHMQGLYLKLAEPLNTEEIPAMLDRAALDRILMNLISNAIKFTHYGGITISVTSEAESVWIEVSDTGIGIEEASLQKIFQEFQQESTGLTRKYEGSGLGLAITKGMVHLLDGEIEVESQVGEGSTFRVRLPRYKKAKESQSTQGPRTALPRRMGRKPHVLAVEDHDATRTFLRHLLQGHYELDLVASPDQAQCLATLYRYDLVILDINLGEGGDGVELMHELRENPAYQRTPIIACTAYAIPGDRDRFMEAGFNGYVSKPFTRDDLFEVIHRVMHLG